MSSQLLSESYPLLFSLAFLPLSASSLSLLFTAGRENFSSRMRMLI